MGGRVTPVGEGNLSPPSFVPLARSLVIGHAQLLSLESSLRIRGNFLSFCTEGNSPLGGGGICAPEMGHWALRLHFKAYWIVYLSCRGILLEFWGEGEIVSFGSWNEGG